MTYNMTIQNKGPLPISYIYKVGNETLIAGSLHNDRPIHCDVIMIGATQTGQILVHCTQQDYIVTPSPDLEIVFAGKQPTSDE
jgi:hypothetical protein